MIQEIAVQTFWREFHNPLGIQAAVGPLPPDARPDIFISNAASDAVRGVPQADGVEFLPLCLGVTQGYYANLLRVRNSGVLSCHKHFGAVHAYVIKGRWFCLEHEECLPVSWPSVANISGTACGRRRGKTSGGSHRETRANWTQSTVRVRPLRRAPPISTR